MDIFKSLKEIVVRPSILPGTNYVAFDKRLRNPLVADPILSADMNKNGSITPIVYEYKPAAGKIEVIEYVTLLLIDEGTFTADQFGSLARLANGLELQSKSNGGADNVNTSLHNNSDVIQCFTGAVGVAGVGVNEGAFGTGDWIGGSYMFDKNPMILDGDKGDYIRFTVADNLSTIDTLRSSVRIWRKN